MPQIFDPVSYTWNPYAVYHGIAGVLIIFMGLFTVYRERGTRVGRLYLFYTISLASWILSLAIILVSTNETNALFLTRLGNAAVALLPAIFFHISTILLNLNWVKRFYINLFWIVSSVFALLALSSVDYINHMHQYHWGYFGIFGPLGTAFTFYFTALIVYTVYQYIPVCRKAKPESALRKRATLLLISFLIGLMGTIDFIPAFGIDVPPHGVFFILILFAITTYVTWRYRLVDITAEYAADNILNLINSPLVVLDLEGELRLSNEAANGLLTITKKQELLATLFQIAKTHWLGEIQQDVDHSIENVEFDYPILDKRHVFSLSISPLMSRQNTLIAYVCLLRDITERKCTEELLRKTRDDLEDHVKIRTQQLEDEVEQHKQTAEALLTAKNFAEGASQAKTEFLSRISHELRTPLNALLGFTQLLQLDMDQISNQEHRQYIEQMSKSGEHLLNLIEDILDLSRIEMGKISMSIEPINIAPIIDEGLRIVEHMAKPDNIRIINNVETGASCNVMADRTRFKQIIINLISNAVKYNREDGSVTIECKKTNGKYHISIADTGIGISEKDQQRVFEPFERLDNWRHHTEGAGIGLTLSRRLAYEMKGDLDFTSELGVGSTFWLDLPAAE